MSEVHLRLTEQELKDLVRSQASRRVAGKLGCPSEDLLLRAAARHLDRRERETVASHLMICSDCVRDYRIAHLVKGWAGQMALSEGPEAGQAGSERRPGGIGLSPRHYSGHRTARVYYSRILPVALAASLVIVAALCWRLIAIHGSDGRNASRLTAKLAERDRAIADLEQSIEESRKSAAAPAEQSIDKKPEASQQARIAELEATVAQLSKPQFNVPIIDLEPSPARGEGGASLIEVPRSASVFTLILHTSARQPRTGYTMEILSEGGKVIFRGRAMKTTPDNGLTTVLSHHLMPAGKYRIRLYTLDGDRTEPIEQYGVEVRYR